MSLGVIPPLIRLFLLGALLSVWTAGNVYAQAAPSPVSFDTLMTRWSRVLEEIDRYVQGPEYNPERSADYRIRAERVRIEALAAKTEAETGLEATRKLIEALGPAPGEGQLPESEALASERHLYTERSLDLRTRIALAELIAVQADGLAQAIVAVRRQAAMSQFLTRDPSVLFPSTLMAASGELVRLGGELVRLHGAWWVSGPPIAGGWRGWIGPAMWVLLVALVSWALRYLILTHFGRDAYLTEPSYPRRFAAAIAEGLARAVFPALIFVFIIVVMGRTGSVGDRSLNRIYTGLLVGLALFVLVTALTRAVLAPDLPAWQLTELAAEKARIISRRVTFLAAVFAFDRFLVIGFAGYASSFTELINVLGVLVNFLLALGILALTPGHLWRVHRAEEAAEPEQSGSGETRPVSPGGGGFWRYLRGLVAILAVLGIAALVIGYGYIAEYLLHNILFTGIIFGFLFLVRGLVAELPVSLLRSSRLGRDTGAQQDPMTGPRVGLSNLFTAFLVLVGLALCFPFWARGFMPLSEVWSWMRDVLRGFTVGNVTISLTDIMVAVGAFFAVLILTGLLQRVLLQKLLPQTRLTSGLQHSIATGTGYLGIVVALAMGIAMLGVDLTNLALVAGALSVGIGFGLQGVVNNFVSGLILLFERPIRVGDWVVMNDQSGFIKRINIRATELETFDKSSVIIPNADILANMVVNWTHKDDFGRVDVRVGVAYDADTGRVREVLLSCAREHPLVLAHYPGLEPFVLFQDYGRNRLEFELRCYTPKVVERTVIASDLRFEIERRFREEGINIPLPQEVLHFPDGWPPMLPGDNV